MSSSVLISKQRGWDSRIAESKLVILCNSTKLVILAPLGG